MSLRIPSTGRIEQLKRIAFDYLSDPSMMEPGEFNAWLLENKDGVGHFKI